jgi:hypothetical protein
MSRCSQRKDTKRVLRSQYNSAMKMQFAYQIIGEKYKHVITFTILYLVYLLNMKPHRCNLLWRNVITQWPSLRVVEPCSYAVCRCEGKYKHAIIIVNMYCLHLGISIPVLSYNINYSDKLTHLQRATNYMYVCIYIYTHTHKLRPKSFKTSVIKHR